jgi:hypothetical protein
MTMRTRLTASLLLVLSTFGSVKNLQFKYFSAISALVAQILFPVLHLSSPALSWAPTFDMFLQVPPICKLRSVSIFRDEHWGPMNNASLYPNIRNGVRQPLVILRHPAEAARFAGFCGTTRGRMRADVYCTGKNAVWMSESLEFPCR